MYWYYTYFNGIQRAQKEKGLGAEARTVFPIYACSFLLPGLMDHYYDGCIGFLPTPDRLNSFNFTLPYTPSLHAALFWKEGSEGDHHDVTGKKVGEL